MYWSARSSSCPAYRRWSSWQKLATLRSGSCRSCEATYANCSRSRLDRVSSSACALQHAVGLLDLAARGADLGQVGGDLLAHAVDVAGQPVQLRRPVAADLVFVVAARPPGGPRRRASTTGRVTSRLSSRASSRPVTSTTTAAANSRITSTVLDSSTRSRSRSRTRVASSLNRVIACRMPANRACAADRQRAPGRDRARPRLPPRPADRRPRRATPASSRRIVRKLVAQRRLVRAAAASVSPFERRLLLDAPRVEVAVVVLAAGRVLGGAGLLGEGQRQQPLRRSPPTG